MRRRNIHNKSITGRNMENQGEEQLRSEARLKALEERLLRLEEFLKLPRQVIPPVHVPPAAAAQPQVLPQPPASVFPPPARPPLPARAVSKPGGWLGVVAVICFVLAAGFIIKLSLDSGWLTPLRQVGLASLLGLGLIVAGIALSGADSEYAGYLPAAGIIVLYASVFAAHRFYSLIPFESAISLTTMVSALCVWLYTRLNEDVYPVTAAVGSYLAPVVLSLGASAVFSLYYFLLASIAFALISIWVRSRILTIAAAYLAVMMTAFTGLALHEDGLIVAMLALNFVVFSGGIYLYTRHNGTPLTEKESVGLLPVMLFFYAMEYYYIERITPGLAPWLSLGFAAILLGLYLSARERFPGEVVGSGPAVLAFVTVVCFHSFYLELLPGDFRPWLFVAITVGLCLPGIRLSGGAVSRVPAMGVLAVLLLEYLSMMSHLLNGGEGQWLLVSMFSLAGLWLLIGFKSEEFSSRGNYWPLLGAAHLLAVLGLYRLTKDAGSLYVSASWLLYALGVIAFAFSRLDETLARSAVFVLGFAAGKALLYDAAAAPTVVRIFCLLLTGAGLYGAGFFLRQISGWKKGQPG